MLSSGKKIGVLTGGGDCPGLNAVIRAVVKTAINVYDMEVIGLLDGYEGLIYPEKTIVLGYDSVKGILPQGGTILGSSNRGNPFAFPEERDGKVVAVDYSDRVVENYHKLGLDCLIVIGGDGTLKLATSFKNNKGLNIVGVPKTIDNDLFATDQTFGFDSAVVTATEAIDKLHSTAESHHRIMFVEVMGRDAGWIALHAGLAGGADAILIPEIPYFIEKLQSKIELRESRGRKFSIVVVAEGARPVGGEMSVVKRPAFDLPRLGGAAQRVADEIEKLMGKETRVTVLGHIQRGGSPTPFDRNLGTRFGTASVHLAAEGRYGRMVCLRGREIDSVDMEVAVAQKKYVDPKGEMVQTARALGIDFCSVPEDVKL